MPRFDFEASRRWARFDPRRTLGHRADEELPFANQDAVGGPALLLDTCVYIDKMQGRAPRLVAALASTNHTNHSTVAIQELMHTVGALDPEDRRTAGAIAAIGMIIGSMPEHRVFTPDVDVLGRAALLSGMISRLQGYGRNDRLRAQQDCILFLQAHKLGLTVLTANVRDFDLLLQLVPAGKVLFYRKHTRSDEKE